MKKHQEHSDLEYQRLLAQERLIFGATEQLVALLELGGVSRTELADRLGRSKPFVTQILSGERNMTLRTLADAAYVLGYEFQLDVHPAHSSGGRDAAPVVHPEVADGAGRAAPRQLARKPPHRAKRARQA